MTTEIKPIRRVSITKRQRRRLENCRRALLEAQQAILWGNPNAAAEILPHQVGVRTARELADDYFRLTSANLAPKTILEKRHNLSKFVNWLGPQPFTRESVERFVVDLHAIDWAASTKWFVGSSLGSFLTWLYDTKRIADDWRRGIKFPPKPAQKPRENYSKEEIERLLEAAGDRPLGFVVRLGYHTGFALVDACNLCWRDLDMEKGVIRRPRQKTGVESIITFDFGTPMRAALEAQLQDTIRAFGSVQPEFPVCRFAANNKHAIAVMFKRLCAKAGVKYRSFHSLRASMLTELGMSDAPLAVCMSVAGLRDPKQFLSYISTSPEKVRAELSRIRQ